MTRNAAFNSFMAIPANVAVYTADIAMTTIAAKMATDSATAVTSSIAAEADNTGYSAEKEVAKVAVCATAAALCANSQVKLDLLGNLIVSKKLNGTTTYYYGVADALCGSRLMAVYDVMLANLLTITVDYLTAAQLTAFLTQINTFTGLTGTTSSVVGGASVVTKQFATDLKVTNADIVIVKKVGLKYKKTNIAFYNSLIKACKIPAIAVRHTIVVINITDASTTGVLAGVNGTLTKSKDLQVSNVAGVMTYPKVPAGNSTATFAKVGYITQVMQMDILQGKTNTSAVALTPGIMTSEQEAAVKITLAEAIAAEKAASAARAKAKREAKAASVVLAATTVAETTAATTIETTAAPAPKEESI